MSEIAEILTELRNQNTKKKLEAIEKISKMGK